MPCGMKGIFLPDGSPVFHWHNTLSIHYLLAMGAPRPGNIAWKWFSLSLASNSWGPFIWWYIFLLERQVGILSPTGRTLISHQGFVYFDLWPLHLHQYILYCELWPASMSPSKINHNLPESHIFMPLNSERLGNVMKWGQSMQQNFNLIPLRRIFFMQKYSLRFAHLTSVTTRA